MGKGGESGDKLGLNRHLGSHQRFIRNSHISYNRVMHLLTGCQVSSFGYLLLPTLPRRNVNVYFCSESNRHILEGLGAIAPVNKVRWAEILITGVLIAVQMSFKGFQKAQSFTKTFYSTQSLSFWSNFDLNLPLEDDQNKK